MADDKKPFNPYGNDYNKDGIVGGKTKVGADKGYDPRQKQVYGNRLDGTQHDPAKKSVINFKQDYTVLIRRKKYYAITQQSDELYTRVFQINNFNTISTSHSTSGRIGQCTVNLKGAERVVVASKDQIKNAGFKNFDALQDGWNSIDDEAVSKGNELRDYKGIDYGSLMKVREYKYSWKFAEKCEWEPMDEIHVFSKSKVVRKGGKLDGTDQFEFVQIFFGYITQITKTFTPQNGPSISIFAEDHLKLLNISRMSMRPPLDMAVGGVGMRYDGLGNLIIEDNPKELQSAYTHFFAGALPHEIVKNCARGAGIPDKYIHARVEPILRVPFVPNKGNNFGELYSASYQTRLSFCSEAARILNLEFFADETGQIVLKIPSYTPGINRMPLNDFKDPRNKYEFGAVSNVSGSDDKWWVVTPTTRLATLAKAYYGTPNQWRTIANLNGIKDDKDMLARFMNAKILVRRGNKYKAGDMLITSDDGKQPVSANAGAAFTNNRNEATMSEKFDHLIRVIEPEEILSFTLVDSDQNVYTAAQVTVEPPFLQSSLQQLPPAVTRAVQDPYLIRQFGYRIAPSVTTPLISDADGAAKYAALLILQSVCNRYTGSITMIEEPTIRVGDPIRFFSYDEHPETELYRSKLTNGADRADGSDNRKAQSVYYVESINRTINVNSASTMTLTLKAGRVAGVPSIYDQCQELYRYFYEDAPITDISKDKGTADKVKDAKEEAKKSTTKTHTVAKGESLYSIAKKYYNDGNKWKIIYDANRKDQNGKPYLTHPSRIYPGKTLVIPPLDSTNKSSSSSSSSSAKPADKKVQTRAVIHSPVGYTQPLPLIDEGGYSPPPAPGTLPAGQRGPIF